MQKTITDALETIEMLSRLCDPQITINCAEVSVMSAEHLYGPGKRLLIYLQGCSLHCRGCFNKALWKFGKGRTYSARDILTLCEENEVEGVTVLGGEPLDQEEGLWNVLYSVKKAGYTVILFTGYEEDELTTYKQAIWDISDIVICGRFIAKRKNLFLQFRGSDNQRVITHEGPYKDYQVKDGLCQAVIIISEDGETELKGFYPDSMEMSLDGLLGEEKTSQEGEGK